MNTELKKAIDLASEAVEQLQKSEVGGSIHTETLLKSHVKEYTRTTASGASVQVKEHDDKRQAAEEATKAADKHQAGMDWSKPDTKKLQELHHDAAKKHIDAMEAAHQAGDGESMRHHFHKASMHLGAAGSAGTFHRKDAADNAKAQTAMADHISAIAAKHKGEKTAHDLDHGSSIHLLAMEQHQRASAAHSAHHNSVYGTPEADEANSKAEGHQSAAREHGKSVQHFSGIAIKASDHAYNIGKAADKSKNPEDHKEAAALHRHAASLDFDSEGRAEHEAKAKEHEKKSADSSGQEPEHYYKKGGKDGMRQVALSASKKATASGNKEDHQEAARLNNKAMEMAKNEHDDAAFDVHSKIAVKHELATEHDKKTSATEKPAGSKFRSGSAEYQAADKEAFEAGDKAKTKEDHAKAAALHLKAAGHAEPDSADEDLHMNMVKEHNRSAK